LKLVERFKRDRPYFAFVDPVKLGEGWAKCMSQFYELGPALNDLWYSLLLVGEHSAVWEIRAWVSKKYTGKT